MKKLVTSLLLTILLFQLVLAVDLEVEITNPKDVILVELDNPASFTLEITNNDISDSFEIFSLVGVSIFPKESFPIDEGETIKLEIQVVPHRETIRDFRDIYAFEYQLKGKQTGFYKDRLVIKILELQDIIDIQPENIDPDKEEATLVIKNLEDLSLTDLKVEAKSFFFEFSETISLLSKEQKDFTVPVKKDQVKKLSAGDYQVDVTLEINGKSSKQTRTLKYLEKGSISTFSSSTGFIIRKVTKTKTNEGNINEASTISERKDILSRLFTTYSESPLTSERNGLFVDYTWEKELSPGEQLSITATTNYTLPFVIVIVIVLFILIIKFVIRIYVVNCFSV